MAKTKGALEHQPTDKSRQQVEMLSAYGLKQDAIAAIIGVSDVTLRKYYDTELKLGLSKVTAQVANALVKKALGDTPQAVNAAKFFLQSQAGWAERTSVEVKKPANQMTDDELAIIAAGGSLGDSEASSD